MLIFNIIILSICITIQDCDDVQLSIATDPFTQETTVSGRSPDIITSPYIDEQDPWSEFYAHPEVTMRLIRNNDSYSISITNTMRYAAHTLDNFIGEIKFGDNTSLLLLLENDELITLKYQSGSGSSSIGNFSNQRVKTAHSNFTINQSNLEILSTNKIKLIRIEYENDRADRELNERNTNNFMRYINCLI